MAWLISKAMMDNCSNSPCSQGQAAVSSAESCLDGDASVPSNSTSMPQAYWLQGRTTVRWKPSRSGLMCAVSGDGIQLAEKCFQHFAGSVIDWFCRVDSLAPTYQSQEQEQASKEPKADSGGNKPVSFARFDRDTFSLKTHQRSLLGGWMSFSGTLPRWGTMRDGALYRQQTPSGLRELRQSITSAKESGLGRQMPTPNTEGYRSDGELRLLFNAMPEAEARAMSDRACESKKAAASMRVPTATVCGNYNRKGSSATSGDGLETFVQSMKIPSPSASMMTMADMVQAQFAGSDPNRPTYTEAASIGTPTASNKIRSETFADGRSPNPREFAEALPTPTAHNSKECNAPTEMDRKTPGLGSIVGGSLNPDWVEFLQGWPIGWTDLNATPKMIPADWSHEHGIPRVAVGVPNRAARLTALGNGQVPQCMAMAWKMLSME